MGDNSGVPATTINWRLQGKCSRLSIAESDRLFFSRGRTSNKAKTFCKDCPVIEKCLELALQGEHQFGVWAGTSERERKKLLKPQYDPLPGSVGVTKRVKLEFFDVTT